MEKRTLVHAAMHVVIIGNGISGVTAARFIRKISDDARITVISDETDYFYSRTALMYVYMGHMRYKDIKPYEDWFWQKNRIDLRRDFVEEIDTASKHVGLRSGSRLDYDVLIIAAGSRSIMPEWPGRDLRGVQGLYGMPDLKEMERSTAGISRAVVVGGGLIGIEMVEMLHSRHIPVTFLVRESGYMDHLLPPQESAMVSEEIRNHGIELRLGTELRELLGDDEGRVRAAVAEGGEEIACEFAGLAVGVRPNIDFVQSSDIETNRGVLVNEFFETSVDDVFAVGDCAEFREDGIGSKRIEQLWYTGRMHGKTVARTICGARTAYDPGPYFNSAKFLTIEWQTYGTIHPVCPPGVDSLVWHDPARNRLIRIDFEKETGCVLGFNLMGVRYRHPVCERWLREERPIEYVLEHLGQANFDPEFARRHEPQLKQTYSSRRPAGSFA